MVSKNPVTKRKRSSTTGVLQNGVKVVLGPVAHLALCNGIREFSISFTSVLFVSSRRSNKGSR